MDQARLEDVHVRIVGCTSYTSKAAYNPVNTETGISLLPFAASLLIIIVSEGDSRQ